MLCVELLLDHLENLSQLAVLVPARNRGPLVVESGIFDVLVGDSGHNLDLRSNHWEALAQNDLKVKRLS